VLVPGDDRGGDVLQPYGVVVEALAVGLLDVQPPYAQPPITPDLGLAVNPPSHAVQTSPMVRATCALCGQQAESEDVPLTWMTSIEDGRKLLYCDRCARENVRSIEGKLDSVYW
jgi:hypothetical protein